MDITYVNGQVTALAGRAVLVFTVLLAGCASSTAGSSLMGTRAEVRAPPKARDLSPNLEIMTLDEQLKLKKELIAARDRQAASVKAPGKSTGAQPTHQAVQPTK